ncbi:hypothetical protein [Paraburkholderia fungorum]|uniref:hypothetical protein n=1 Tax=Paraburkholderia fungorum TaxID=134537 RepID=UPI0038BB2E66
MVESISWMLLGAIVLIMAAILVAEHYRREHHRNQRLRWLDTHPMRDWLHRRP